MWVVNNSINIGKKIKKLVVYKYVSNYFLFQKTIDILKNRIK